MLSDFPVPSLLWLDYLQVIPTVKFLLGEGAKVWWKLSGYHIQEVVATGPREGLDCGFGFSTNQHVAPSLCSQSMC